MENSTFRIKEGISVRSNSTLYKVLRILRYTTFGQIAECRNQRTGEILAIKFVKNKFYSQNKREAKILKELKSLNLHEYNIVNFVECFSYKDRVCLVYEKLESNYLDSVLATDGKPVHLTEIRAIAYQMLVALTTLHNSGFTHANIIPENILRLDEISHKYGVKLTGFSNSAKTSDLNDVQISLACGYTAPEIYLDCPLDESVDIWSLGLMLAFLFLGKHMGPVDCEYQYMKFIVDVLGQPEKHVLDKGCQSSRFFKQVTHGSDYIWKFKTPKEFEKTTGSEIKRTACNNMLDLDYLFIEPNQPEPIEYFDIDAFLDLLKKMLKVNPADRIKPADALNHPFITMENLRLTSNKFYVKESQRIMKECQNRKPGNVYPSLSNPNSESSHLSEEEKNNPSRNNTISLTHSVSKPLKLEPGYRIKGKSNVYVIEEKLGAGSYGQVVRCRIEGTNTSVALKITGEEGVKIISLLNEARTLACLNSLNYYKDFFIKSNDYFVYQNYTCMELELLDKSLFHYLNKQKAPLKVAEVRAIAQQMLEALSVLKHFEITHADIKPDNIMLVDHETQPFRVKLIDFGLVKDAKKLSEWKMEQVIPYRAPEVILGLPRDEAIDTWSIGCVLSELFLCRHLFPSANEHDNLRMIMELCGKPKKKLLKNGNRVSDFFRRKETCFGPMFTFITLEEYKMFNTVFRVAHPDFDKYKTLDDLFFSKNTNNATENEDIKAFLDLVKKMLTTDPAERILPADALKHPFLTMTHLDGASDASYVREACKVMRDAQCRKLIN